MILKTQYYIKVPGTAFTFLALLSFVSGCKKEKSFRYALISGFLAGLAFYSYFIYLFFVPAYIYLYLKEKKKYNLFLQKETGQAEKRGNFGLFAC